MSMNARRYFKADLVAVSPIKLASGQDGLTDSDVLVDATGSPFIPGTALSGVARHYVRMLHAGESVGNRTYDDYWFGYIEPGKDDGAESLVRFYDAFPIAKASISSRDGVKLNAFKTADAHGKHDYQVIDAGAAFSFRVEIRYDSEDEAEGVSSLLSDLSYGLCSGDIRIGGKTSRGFGEVRLENMRVLDIDLSTAEGVEAYANFDWETSSFDPFAPKSTAGSAYEPAVRIPLKVCSALMIRDYGTTEASGHEGKLVDAEMLKNAQGNPIIPGTTWAGAFRNHMRKVLLAAKYGEPGSSEDAVEGFLDRVFGSVGNGRSAKSKIVFSESVVAGSQQLNSTRNAIDRFTGGAADQKLFTNQLSYGGSTELTVKWRKDIKESDKRLLESLVQVCADDLCDGTLAVGGMTATGAGVFEKMVPHDGEGAL